MNDLTTLFPREPVLDWLSENLGVETISRLRDEFYEKTGKVFSEDNFFDARMDYFSNRLIFDTPLNISDKGNGTGYSLYFDDPNNSASKPVDLRTWHSLFLIKKNLQKNNSVILYDMLKKEKTEATYGDLANHLEFQKNSVLQGYLIKENQTWKMAPGFVFHPFGMHRYLTKMIKTLKQESIADTQIIDHAAKAQIWHLRHQHVKPEKMYKDYFENRKEK